MKLYVKIKSPFACVQKRPGHQRRDKNCHRSKILQVFRTCVILSYLRKNRARASGGRI